MVTGVETAGLVLGSIPLILAGLEFYAKGIAVSKRYIRHEQQFRALIVELRVENAICSNTLNLLLKGIVKQKDMSDFLANPCGDRWKDPKFDKKLQQRLNSSYEPYMATIEELERIAETFRQKLKLDANWKPQFNDEQTFKKYYKRLAFSLKKADYDDTIAALRRANSSLHRLTTQTISLESPQIPEKTCKYSPSKYTAINDRAHGFHSALKNSWQCTCHSDRTVNLRLDDRMHNVQSDESDDDDDDESRDEPFHVLFRYSQANQTTIQSAPVIKHSWSWEEAEVRITVEEHSGVATVTTASSKSVHFQTKAHNAVKAALKRTPNLRPIQNLCAAICTLQQPQRDVCLSLLAEEYAKQKYGVLIYPSKDPPFGTEGWTVSSLGSVLHDPAFARRNRLRLAVTLASSVLQLHETPWLSPNWRKDDILFIKRTGSTAYDQPFVAKRFDTQDQSAACGCPVPSSMNRIIRNQTLYALGISLIELWYGQPLSALREDEDKADNEAMTEWNTAARLADDLYNEAGGRYSDAVRRCIRCEFNQRASNLMDVGFQRAVYEGVVAQLKETLDFM